MELLSYEEAAQMSEVEVWVWIAEYERFKHREECRAWTRGMLCALGFAAVVIPVTWLVFAANGWI